MSQASATTATLKYSPEEQMVRRPEGELIHLVNYFGRPENEVLERLDVDWDYVPISPEVVNVYHSHLFFDINSNAKQDPAIVAEGFVELISNRIFDLYALESIQTEDVIKLLCSSTIRLDTPKKEHMIQDFVVNYFVLPPTPTVDDIEVTIYYRHGRPVCLRCDDLFAIYFDDDLIHVGVISWGTATFPSSYFFDLDCNS